MNRGKYEEMMQKIKPEFQQLKSANFDDFGEIFLKICDEDAENLLCELQESVTFSGDLNADVIRFSDVVDIIEHYFHQTKDGK